MKRIGELFTRILEARSKGAASRLAVREALLETAGLDVDVGSISFSGRSVLIAGLSQGAKSAIYIKKEALLASLAAKPTGRVIEDVKAA